MSERVAIDFSQPEALFRADPEMYDRLAHVSAGHGIIMNTVHIDGTPFSRNKHPEILNALGDYKDQIIDAAETISNDKVVGVEYFINRRSVKPNFAQINAYPHMDSIIGGIGLISASILPTVLYTRSDGLDDADFNPDPYVQAKPYGKTPGDYVIDEPLLRAGIADGQLQETRLNSGDVFVVSKRIHASDRNLTNQELSRVFVTAEVTLKGMM